MDSDTDNATQQATHFRQLTDAQYRHLARELIALDEEGDWGSMDPFGRVGLWQLKGELDYGSSGASGRLFRASCQFGWDAALEWVAPARPNAMWESQAARQVSVLRQIGHYPHILGLFDAGRHLGRSYLVTELAKGDLDSLLSRRHRSHPGRLSAQGFRGLASAHTHGIVHGDVNPRNILLLEDWDIAIGGWGIDRPREARDTEYMAPEVLSEDPAEVGPPSDVFSMCCVAIQLHSGVRPEQLADGRLRFPPVTDRLGDILGAGMASDPGRRPTAIEMAEALGDLVASDWYYLRATRS